MENLETNVLELRKILDNILQAIYLFPDEISEVPDINTIPQRAAEILDIIEEAA